MHWNDLSSATDVAYATPESRTRNNAPAITNPKTRALVLPAHITLLAALFSMSCSHSLIPALSSGRSAVQTLHPVSSYRRSIARFSNDRITQMSDFSKGYPRHEERGRSPYMRECVRTPARPRTKVLEEEGGPGPTLVAFAGWSCCAVREVC